MVSLLYLKHTYNLSDEELVVAWSENVYYQFFSGREYYEPKAPCDFTLISKFRELIVEEGVEELLARTITVAAEIGLIKSEELKNVVVDSTVMPKAIAHPTDSRLLEKSRQHLVKLASDNNIALRQNYNREAPRVAAQVGRYAHAKQYRRMQKSLRAFKTRVGRVHREIECKIAQVPDSVRPQADTLLQRVQRIPTQKTKDKNKLYALHAPEVECISKGKAKNPYEFRVKVSVATTLREGIVVGMRSMLGNPWNGNTLEETLEQVSSSYTVNRRL
jgi:IS5 family transposase